MADPKIKYDIEAVVKGEADAEQLAKALRNVGDALEGDLQQGAQEAAQALEALAAKQRALDSFMALRRETEQLSTSLATATGVVDRLGAELPQVAAQTQAFAVAERSAGAALQQAQADLTRKRDALRALKEESTGAARKTDEYKAAVAALKDSIKAATVEVKAQQTAQRAAAQAAAQAQGAEAALRKEYDVAIGSAARLSGELRNKNTALAQTREAMQALGVSTTNLAQHERNLKDAVEQVRQSVAAMAPAYQQAAAASSQSTQVQAQNQRSLREGMTSISTQLQRVQQIASVALGGSYAGGLIKDVADTADAFKNLEARIKLATGEGPLFQEAFRGVAEISLRTNSALDETGTLFTKLAKAGQEAGKSAEVAQREALALTETINQTVQLSGGSADSAKAAIVQLIQGLQSGVLRGEEFNSVMEQAPRLAQAMANGLGVTTGELRKLANQGALTAETVMGALRGQADVVAGEFAKLPPTVGRALQNLSTQWTLYVGSADSGMVSSANAAKVINALAANLDTLVTTLQTAGKLWAAIKIAGLASDFGAWALKTLSATTAVEANTVAVGANTLAQRGNSAAVAANAAAQAANTTATAASTAAKAANAASWASIATFAGQATSATQAATAATAASTAAVAGKTAGLGLLGGALRGVTSLLGGPVGLIATVVLFSGEIKRGATAVFEWGMSFTDAGQKLKQYDQSLRDAEARARLAAEAAKEHQAALERQAAALEQARIKSFELSKEAMGLVAQFDKLRKDGDSAAEAIGKIGKDFDLSNVPGIKNAAAVLDMLVADGKLSAEQFRAAWAKALDGKDLAQFEVLARAAFSGAAREGERVGQLLDATVREAVRRTGLDFEQLQGKIGAASRSALNDLDAIVGGLDRLKSQGVDTGRVLAASLTKAIDTADSQKAIDEVRARVESLRKELGNKVADGLLDQIKAKAEAVKDALDKAVPGVTSLREAMKQLGVVSDESLRNTAATSKQAYDAMTTSGKASARELSEGFRRAAEEAIAANNGIAPSWVTAQAGVRGFKLEADGAGKTILRSMADAKKAVESVGDAAGRAGKGFRAMGRDAADAADIAKRLRSLSGGDRNHEYSGIGPNGEFKTDEARALAQQAQEWSDKGQSLVAAQLLREASAADGKQAVENSRNNHSGNATLTKEYVDSQIAKQWGEQFIGDSDAMELFNAQIKLDAYRTNYGNVVRSQQSLNEQHALLQAVQRLEEKLRARQADGLNKRLTQADDDGAEPEPTTRRSRTTGGGGVQGGMQTGAVASGTVVNLNYNGVQLGAVNTDASGRQALQKFMDALTQARSVAR